MAKTYSQLYIATRKAFREAGIEAHSLEARIILAHASGKTTEKLLRDMSLYTSDEVERKLDELVQRRLSGEPVAYITGSWEFYGLPLEITPDVLIPRADTEVAVDKALELLGGKVPDARILDLCTGSGCIGCAIASQLPASRAVLIDISEAALEVAKRNIRLNDLSSRVVCVQSDVTEPPPLRLGSFDLIISNPPYIETNEIPTLDSSVKDFEPHLALDGGNDGLDFYRIILDKWKELLRQSGHIVFEVGETQAEDVAFLMRLKGFRNVTVTKDTAGHDRVVSGKL